MLPQKKRLTREAFSRFFAIGKRVRSDSFDVVYSPHPTFHGAVVVSKKVARKATQRNMVRRSIYAILRAQTERCGVYIVLVRRLPHSHATLKSEFEDIFRKIKI